MLGSTNELRSSLDSSLLYTFLSSISYRRLNYSYFALMRFIKVYSMRLLSNYNFRFFYSSASTRSRTSYLSFALTPICYSSLSFSVFTYIVWLMIEFFCWSI